MTSLNKTYKELSFPLFKEVFEHIDAVCRKTGVEFYLIGAQARDIHFLEKNIQPLRGTQDIDFAIMLPDIKAYDKIKHELIKRGFKIFLEIPHRLLYHATQTMVDLLPFGGLEENGMVSFSDDKHTELSVLGMAEVMQSVIEKEISSTTFKVSPLEGIFILKLISFNDNPGRTKDLEDMKDILLHYFEINRDRFYEFHLDVLDELGDDFQKEAGARLIGRDIRLIIDRSEKLRNRILSIIDTELGNTPGSFSQYLLSKEYFPDFETLNRYFALIKKGLLENK